MSYCKRFRGREARERRKGEAVVLQVHRYFFLHAHLQLHFFFLIYLKWLFFFSIFWLVIYQEDSRFYRVFRANGTLKIIVCIKYCNCSCCERQRCQSIDCVLCVSVKFEGSSKAASPVSPDTHHCLPVTFLRHILSQGEPWQGSNVIEGRREDVDWTALGGVRGEVSGRAKAGLKSTRKGFYFSWVAERAWARFKGKAF